MYSIRPLLTKFIATTLIQDFIISQHDYFTILLTLLAHALVQLVFFASNKMNNPFKMQADWVTPLLEILQWFPVLE